MVRLNKIYTRTGDDGTTGLASGPRRSKSDRRVEAIGTVDELNALLGLVRLDASAALDATLSRIQNDLFDLGADLSTPLQSDPEYPPLRVKQQWIDELEADCDHYLEQVEPLRSFILPGGTLASAHLHHATTVVRRAERSAWAAREEYGEEVAGDRGVGGVNPLTTTYLNRLSDLLFILSRVANQPAGGGKSDEVLWVPGGERAAEHTPDRNSQRAQHDTAQHGA